MSIVSNLEKADIVDVVLFLGNLHVNPTVKKRYTVNIYRHTIGTL